MNQLSSLSDVFSQTSSLLSGLLSQIGGNGVDDNLFSSLLSQNGGSDFGASQMAATPAVSSSAISPLSSSSPTSSGSDLLQALENIASTMQNALAALHRQQNTGTTNSQQSQSSASGDNQTASQSAAQNTTSATTQNGVSSPNISAPTNGGAQQNNQSSTASASAPTSTSDGTGASSSTDSASAPSATDLQNLAALIAQMLVLIQTMIQDLQPKVAVGTTPDNFLATTSPVSAPDATSGGIPQNGNILPDAEAAIDSELNSASTSTASPSASQNASPAAASPADELAQLLKDLQAITQSLLPTQQASTPAQNISVSSASASDATDVTLSEITAQIVSLDTTLNNFVTAVRSQNKNSSMVNTAPSSSAPNIMTSAASASQNAILIQPTPANLQMPAPAPTKQDLSGTLQNQAFSFQNNASGSTTSSNSAQIFANGVASLSAAASGGGNSSTDSGGDFLPNNQNSASQITLGTNSLAAVEGSQATGTYNFASTLSALRATNGGSMGLPSVVDQVILQMNRNVKSGNDQMTLQLNPADLGKITVKLDIGSDGKVQGTVTADNPQTLSLIQKDSRSLERALQDAGLRADPGSLQFSLSGGENGGGNNAGQTANNGNNLNDLPEDGTVLATGDTGIEIASASVETYYITPGGVNIQV